MRPLLSIQKRFLSLQEYQAKKLLSEYQIRTQKFALVESTKSMDASLKSINFPEYVIKAQIMAGGRGKGHFLGSGLKGGVKLTKNKNEIADIVKKMLGYKLVTKQTTAEGVEVKKVMVAEALDIRSEKYFAILLDRSSGGPVMVGSPEGGVDIETVAERTPEKIFKIKVDITRGPTEKQTMQMAANLKFEEGALRKQASDIMQKLYKVFIEKDCSQVEINPLIVTDSQTPEVVCLDAKVGLDDNADFRQKDLFGDRDTAEEDPREVKAREFNLNYIGLDGNIGCLVNGAGLAMATMDICKLHGGSPANFLDVGGSATEQQVKEAFKIITSDKQVKAILVNIFGGIMKCDTIASGIVAAAKDMKLELPLVVRLSGTNVEQGKSILKNSGLSIIAADDLDKAAKLAVAAIQ
ncbi:hypothetical protein MP638_004843 [Amoeboaphelidium occidentale]|nr:hypothetical protein MP638_004843 [Amoeboaphelidium occidentale]